MSSEYIPVRHTDDRMSGDTRHDESDPEQIRANIERTRADMTQTIDAIQERLNPEVLKAQAKEAIREATVGKAEEVMTQVQDSARATGMSMWETIKANPLPAALAGVGIGWLLMSSRKQSHGYSSRYQEAGWRGGFESRYPIGYRGSTGTQYGAYGAAGAANEATHRARDMADEAKYRAQGVADEARHRAGEMKDRAGEMADDVKDRAGELRDRAGDMADEVRDRAGEMAGMAREQVTTATSELDRMMHENPLAVGAVAMGIGAAIGLMLPETRKEHEFFGDARDSLVERAKDTVMESAREAQQMVVERAKDTVEQFAGEAAGHTAAEMADKAASKVTGERVHDQPDAHQNNDRSGATTQAERRAA